MFEATTAKTLKRISQFPMRASETIFLAPYPRNNGTGFVVTGNFSDLGWYGTPPGRCISSPAA